MLTAIVTFLLVAIAIIVGALLYSTLNEISSYPDFEDDPNDD